VEGLLAVLRLRHTEGETFQDATRHFADDGAVIDYEAMLHEICSL
jgi:hypothetical protein